MLLFELWVDVTASLHHCLAFAAVFLTVAVHRVITNLLKVMNW